MREIQQREIDRARASEKECEEPFLKLQQRETDRQTEEEANL